MKQTVRSSQPDEMTQAALADYPLLEVPTQRPGDRQIAQLRQLWRHRRFLLRGVVTGFAISTLLVFVIPKTYVSTAQLMPPDSQSASASGMAMMAAMASKVTGGPGAMAGGLGSVAGDLLGLKTSGALFIGVLKSETVQDHLVEQFDLKKVYHKRYIKDARLKLDERSAISEDRKSGIITIEVTDHDPKRAAALANAYVAELNSLVADLSTSAAHRERVFLEARLKVVKEGLDEITKEFAQYSSQSNTLDLQQEGKAMLDVAASLEGQLVAAQAQLEGLRQIYTDNNSRVQALKARVTELQKEMDKLSGSNMSPGDSNGGSSSPLGFPSIRSLPILGIKYADYYRAAKIQETVYELLTQQYELAKVQEAKETPSVKVLDPGLVPEDKSFPPRGIFIFIGTTLAFAGCIVWLWGEERWKEVDPTDARKMFLEEVVHRMRAWVTKSRRKPQESKEYDRG